MRSFTAKLSVVLDERIENKGIKKSDGVKFLREKIFLTTLGLLILFGLPAYLSGVALAFLEKLWTIVIFNSIAYFSFIFLFLNQSISTNIKVKYFLVLLYCLGIVLIITIGPFGAGLLWLICFSIVATVFGGIISAVKSIIVNSLTILFLGVGIHFEFLNNSYFDNYTFLSWMGIAVNLILVNILSSMLIAYFIDNLKLALIKERELKLKLKKKSERLIIAKAKAEESDQLKSAFLANVSHEFRTPMNSIIGFTDMLLLTDPDEEKRRRFLLNIQSSSEQLLQIIHNTIEYSRIEIGTIEFDISKVEIISMLQTIDTQFRHKCPNGVEFICSYPESDSEVFIITDHNKFIQIFSNLIRNAFKFTKSGKVIFGRVESPHDKFYHFFVSDTGVGIRKEKQNDIFTRFHKENDFKEGTGLGLSISATLIAHMGGRIWLESEQDIGSTFNFIIPRKLIKSNY